MKKFEIGEQVRIVVGKDTPRWIRDQAPVIGTYLDGWLKHDKHAHYVRVPAPEEFALPEGSGSLPYPFADDEVEAL